MNRELLKFRTKTLATAIIKRILHFLGILILGFFIRRGRSNPKFPQNKPLKILYVCIGYRGDFILNFTVLRAIKRHFPNAIITCWIKEYNKGLAALNTDINDTLVYDDFPLTGIRMIWSVLRLSRRHPLIEMIKSREFDLCIDDSGYGFSTAICYWAGIPYRIGRNVQGLGFLNNFEFQSEQNSHLIAKRLRLLEPLGISVHNSGELFPSLKIPPSKVLEVAKKYRFNIHASDYFTIQPYGGWEAKNWDDDKFAQVIEKFGEYTGKTAVFIGGSEDADGINGIASGISIDTINTAGKIDLAESAILISGACLHFGVDSFGAQFAAASGVKSLTLFGPTNPLLIAFLGPKNIAVMKKTRCSPPPNRLYCCPDGGRSCLYPTCMRDLEAGQVLEVICLLWEEKIVEALMIF